MAKQRVQQSSAKAAIRAKIKAGRLSETAVILVDGDGVEVELVALTAAELQQAEADTWDAVGEHAERKDFDDLFTGAFNARALVDAIVVPRKNKAAPLERVFDDVDDLVGLLGKAQIVDLAADYNALEQKAKIAALEEVADMLEGKQHPKLVSLLPHMHRGVLVALAAQLLTSQQPNESSTEDS